MTACGTRRNTGKCVKFRKLLNTDRRSTRCGLTFSCAVGENDRGGGFMVGAEETQIFDLPEAKNRVAAQRGDVSKINGIAQT